MCSTKEYTRAEQRVDDKRHKMKKDNDNDEGEEEEVEKKIDNTKTNNKIGREEKKRFLCVYTSLFMCSSTHESTGEKRPNVEESGKNKAMCKFHARV